MENTEQKEKNKRMVWIDAAKFAAMLAIITDHTAGILYTDMRIGRISWFSVGVFILLMGFTSFRSLKRGSYNILKKISGIFLPYAAATFFYTIVQGGGTFDFETFFRQLILFNACGPFYYVLLYIQMVIAAPVLYRLLRMCRGIKLPALMEAGVFFLIMMLSIWTTGFTNILNIYGGGGKLLGGSYLILLYLGMVFAKHEGAIRIGSMAALVLSAVSVILTAGFAYLLFTYEFFLDKVAVFGYGLNPPGITLCVDAILITAMFYFLGRLLDHYPESYPAKFFRAFAVPGSHTLYIFLYHFLIIANILKPAMEGLYAVVRFFNIVRIFFYFATVVLSIGIEILCKDAWQWIKECYKLNKRRSRGSKEAVSTDESGKDIP